MNNIKVKIDTVYRSINKEGVFRLKGTEDVSDIIKNLSSELLTFLERDKDGIDIEDLNKLVPPRFILENFYYGNKIYADKWLELGYKSNVGMVRKLNEDSIVIVKTEVISGTKKSNCSLFILGDGVGGNNKGEVASYLGAKEVAKELLHLMITISEKTSSEIEESIIYSIKAANKVISNYIEIHPECSGMATTLVVALLRGQELYIGNVGDSRAYIIKDKKIKQITKDHSLVQEMVDAGRISEKEASVHPQKNIITRAVGYYRDVDIDIFKEKIYKEDFIMLCSDGLSNVVKDEILEETISKSRNLIDASNNLVRISNEKGGPDNISVIIFKSNNLPCRNEINKSNLSCRNETNLSQEEYIDRFREILKPIGRHIETYKNILAEKEIKKLKINRKITIAIIFVIILLSTLPVSFSYAPEKANEKLITDYYSYMNEKDYKQLPMFYLNGSSASTNITNFIYLLNDLNNTFRLGLKSGFEITSINGSSEEYIIKVNDKTEIDIYKDEKYVPLFYANRTVKYYTRTNSTGFIDKVLPKWKIYDVKWYNKKGNETDSYINAKEVNINDNNTIKTIIKNHYPFFSETNSD